MAGRRAGCLMRDRRSGHPEWQPPEDSFATPFAGGLSARSYPDLCQAGTPGIRAPRGDFQGVGHPGETWHQSYRGNGRHDRRKLPFPSPSLPGAGCGDHRPRVSLTRMITSNMTEDEERTYIGQSVSALTQATGNSPAGWLGPEYGESPVLRSCSPRRHQLRLRLGERRTGPTPLRARTERYSLCP